jgi:hypothetical protein
MILQALKALSDLDHIDFGVEPPHQHDAGFLPDHTPSWWSCASGLKAFGDIVGMLPRKVVRASGWHHNRVLETRSGQIDNMSTRLLHANGLLKDRSRLRRLLERAETHCQGYLWAYGMCVDGWLRVWY